MPSYDRETRVRAPLDEVWDFHSRVTGLEALTPNWMGLRVESVVGPDGTEPELLEEGTEITMSLRPLGVAPPQRWTSRIVERERSAGAAYFRDEMIDGPFDRWVHTHAFYADDGTTIVRDRVDYRLPFGAVGAALGPFSRVGFEPMFRHRHRKTRAILEERARPEASR